MRFCAILNTDGGTFKTLDTDAFCRRIVELFAARGHELDCRPIAGRELERALDEAFADPRYDVVIAGGGDGTISAAAKRAWESGKPFGLLPAGTMNLFARTLKIPLDLDEAAEALAAGHIGRSDIASANGRPFLHQFSIGFHREMVAQRNKQPFESRLGKIKASIVAALEVIRRPPSLPVRVRVDGRTLEERVSSLAVSNNPYGEGHMPYADDVNSGLLGIYYARPATAGANARMLADLTLGVWRNNPDIHELSGREVRLSLRGRKKRLKAVLDGELVEYNGPVEIKMHPGALPLIRPTPPETDHEL